MKLLGHIELIPKWVSQGRLLAAYSKGREETKTETAGRPKKAAHVGGTGVLRQGT